MKDVNYGYKTSGMQETLYKHFRHINCNCWDSTTMKCPHITPVTHNTQVEKLISFSDHLDTTVSGVLSSKAWYDADTFYYCGRGNQCHVSDPIHPILQNSD